VPVRSAGEDLGGTLGAMTTREIAKRLIDELPEDKVDPVVDFIVSRHPHDPDLEALLEEEGDEILAEMDAREDEAARSDELRLKPRPRSSAPTPHALGPPVRGALGLK